MQRKRYEPAWLHDTSVGALLFQADYYLKELSMGECPQPVAGMKSCLDLSAMENNLQAWNGREWFTVRSARVLRTADDVLVPMVTLGVEAREQIIGADGLEDARVTRPDHPLLLYADEFTRNMDLIGERRSAIFHLRELTKAVVLAKFLTESDTDVEQLLGLSRERSYANALCPEVPQLWSDHYHSKILMKQGRILDVGKTPGTRLHSVYGGVDLGLETFMLFGGQPPRTSPLPSWVSISPGFQPRPPTGASLDFLSTLLSQPEVSMPLDYRQLGPLPEPVRARRPTGGVSLRDDGAPRRARRPRRAAPPPADAQGVDLDLGSFNLSETSATSSMLCRSTSSKHALSAGGAAPQGFAATLESAIRMLSTEDKQVIAAVFDPHLSDRQLEGSKFIPPDLSTGRLETFRALVRKEDLVREQRMAHFASEAFQVESPGDLFPSAWKSNLELGDVDKTGPAWQLRPEMLLKDDWSTMVSSNAVFDRRTEDGHRLRVYRSADVEVRTWQEPGGSERPVACLMASPKRSLVSPAGKQFDRSKLEGGQHDVGRRFCPDDGMLYTYEELLFNYEQEYSQEELSDYWHQLPEVPAGYVVEPLAFA